MKSEWLGRRRGEWVAYLRAEHRAAEARRRDQARCPDGMCHGIIPFGAIKQSGEMEAQRLREALSRPILAWRVGSDALGVTLAVECPYCRAPHSHLVEEWDAEAWYEAGCRKGLYQLRLV